MSTKQPYLNRFTVRKESLGWRWDRFLFSVKLIETTVQLQLQRQTDLKKLYHRKADFIYEEYDVSERQQEFEKLDWSFFHRLGIPGRLDEEVRKFPIITEHVSNIVVSVATQQADETADLLDHCDEQMLISICPETLVDWNIRRRYLLNELLHVADMLDPAFLYERKKLGNSPSEEEIVRQRFSLLWRIYVDGRLEHQGETPFLLIGECEQEFDRLFKRVPIVHRKKILEKLWSSSTLIYRQLVGFARDLSELTEWVGASSGLSPDRAGGLATGNSCPICQCRMYHAVRLDEKSDSAILIRIREEFPEWCPDQGICDRCLEYCEL